MTDPQKEFLRRHLIEQESYQTIISQMGVTRSDLSGWYEELKTERMAIAKIRDLWLRKKVAGTFADFYAWYTGQERKCGYCGITEAEIKLLLEAGLLATKRIDTRGKRLELDRRLPEAAYDDLNNLTLACYWCNNAKTDTFTAEEFSEVGQVFAKIWQQRLAQLPSLTM
jgi:5-methylcytosine-specific restriction endonuclease McrA